MTRTSRLDWGVLVPLYISLGNKADVKVLYQMLVPPGCSHILCRIYADGTV